MKRIFAVALVALFVACDTVPRHTVTLTFNDSGDRVTIDASTTLPTRKEARDKARLDRLRDELVSGRDEWALRFQNAAPDRDRVVFDRTAGELSSVQRSATIDADDLQKFFYDLPVTAKVTRGDGWVELAIYPGTSTRFTRADREDFEKRMERGASAARRYINAVRILYEYLDEHPRRAGDVFDAMLRDEDDPRLIVATKREMDLVKEVRDGIDAILEIDWAGDLSREADAVSNPFPATIVVRVPTEPTLIEGFGRDQRGLFIQPKSLLEAVSALEGRWISPDPLAAMLRAPSGTKTEEIVAQLAAAKRHAEPVVGLNEVLAGLTEQLKPADRYRVRFLTKTRVD
jgi:hypothetical protein